MRFATRILVTQILAAAAIVAICLAAFFGFGVFQLRQEASAMGLAIARSVASDPDVQSVAAEYAGQTDPDPAELRDGILQAQAQDVADRTGALFVVIANDRGRRLAHPDADELGGELSTPYGDVLAGEEVVDWETGTLGLSARAKVPIVDEATGSVIGEVSVGFAPARVYGGLPAIGALVAGIAAVALAVGAIVAVLIRRRLERLTRGVQPDEIDALLQSRAAVLGGVRDGVVQVAPDGVIRACNDQATAILELAGDPTGRRYRSAGLPQRLVRQIEGALAGDALAEGELVLDERVAYVEVRGTAGRGAVAVLRDRTDVVALAQRLESVRAATGALRVQRHEFANRMHAAQGLLAAGRVSDAEELIAEFVERGAVPEEAAFAVGDPFLQSFLVSKASEAAERGVSLRMSDDTFVRGSVVEPEDVAAVIGNLVDNAVVAAVAGEEPRWVEVALLDDGDTLALTVTDSGAGVADPENVFENARAREDEEGDAVHGRGIGLPLARRFARRRGGSLQLVAARGEGHGAVFAARLPGTMREDTP
ncbi:sensor histidine kinase [Microbacterium indicum]|uniref:sensor histidine kinase n=1 Tax=Microbacterium indicum TaxID=358100 RepID=UPI0003FC7216|nr:ATP-binding protein [Microbacterium indicum]